MQFTQHPNIFNNKVAALTFCKTQRDAAHCVILVGRKFAVVKREFAKRMKLKEIK
jgi:hypothetical protein